MNPKIRVVRLAALVLLAVSPLSAAPLSRDEVPSPLVPWVRWALSGHEENLCPFFQGNADKKSCVWPGVLTLELGAKGGRFTQEVRVLADSWAVLPGEAGRWPQEARVDAGPVAVVQRDGYPAARLKAGTRKLSGSFSWDSLPELIRIPPETGLLTLTVLGKPVPFPVRDEQGRLWLQKASGPGASESHLEVAVHRQVIDEVPLLLITQVQLRVSGKNRETLLGRALPPGFVPMSLEGPLPAKIERDGRLRVQVRAGTWDIQIGARHEGPAAELKLGEPGIPWDPEEAWVFAARNDLRVVTVEGAPSIDPQQTELPSQWRALPAYLMKPGSVLRLVERRRGDADPKPDAIAINRDLWLDFDGRGLTAQDRVTGTLSRAWRLEMGPETRLGRVAIGGQDQFLTALATGGPAGVEIRQGAVDISADSWLEQRGWSVPAVGWRHDFESASGRLNLPPGWRLIHARGVDSASPTWIKTWTLLDLFLVVILGFSVGRLWGRDWGLGALATAVLCWHEPGALRWVWLWTLGAEALWRVLPEGGFRLTIRALRYAAWACVALWGVPFMVSQVRVGFYPQLERVGWGFAGGGSGRSGSGWGFRGGTALGMVSGAADNIGEESMVQSMEAGERDDGDEYEPSANLAQQSPMQSSAHPVPAAPVSKGAGYKRKSRRARAYASAGRSRDSYAQNKQMLALDPKAAVNTGPGIPTWSWKSVSLAWRGPVGKDERLSLWLIGPFGNLVLALVRVTLTALLALLVFNLPVGDWLSKARAAASSRGLLPALLLLLLPAASGAQSLPSRELLEELRQRILEHPECAPACAEFPRLRLEATSSSLIGRLEVHALAQTAVPLPGGAKQWSPVRVLIDGNPAGVRRSEDGTLWLSVGPGTRQVTFEGPLPESDSVSIPLPMRPRRVEAAVSGWTLHGLQDDGAPEANLQLSRSRGGAAGAAGIEAGNLPAFLEVRRTLRLGLSWEIETVVERRTPLGAPVVLSIPLLEGESVTSAGLRVAGGKLELSMGPQEDSAGWTSVLAPTARIALKAPASASWTEVWRLEAGPVWHAEAKGIAPVHQEPGPGPRAREWRPWPGETVELSLTRPEGVPGQTLTLDQAQLALTPGLRATDATLTLRLRSSRGGEHGVTLPDGAELQSVRIDGAPIPLRLLEGRVLNLPLQPGNREAAIVWRQAKGARIFLRTPEVDAGADTVNAAVSIAMPAERWTLLAGGPRLGPAVLFWSLLAVYGLLAAGLGRLPWTPLGPREWFLLFLGLTQVPVWASGLVAGWLVLLGLRGGHPPKGDREFDVVQVGLAFLTAAALLCVFVSIKRGLLGRPDMQITGNGSTSLLLQWYQDRSPARLPRAWVVSVPLMFYRLAMLAWALWLAHALLGWLEWGWKCLSTEGLWRPLRLWRPKPPEKAPS